MTSCSQRRKGDTFMWFMALSCNQKRKKGQIIHKSIVITEKGARGDVYGLLVC